ncbi:MAG: protein TolR [Acetobacteraceae bacterium]|nr:protein TolR [Acetobacteraceae bacterium]
MAAALQGRSNGKSRYRPLAEINVTPMVDVMLVLLIIFMVTAPLMTSAVPVDLPKANARPVNTDVEPLTVSINAEGKIYLQDAELQLGDLVPKLLAIAENKPDRRIFVRGDRSIAYGRIMEVMGKIAQGGFTKVALLAEQPSAVAPTAAPRRPAAAPRPAERPTPGQPAAPPGAQRPPGRG